MNMHSRNHRFDHSFSEGRLIFEKPSEGYAEQAARVTTEVAIGTVKFGTDIGKDMLNGIYNAWNRDAQSEQVKNEYLTSVSEFSRTMPSGIQKIIEQRFQKGERPSLQELSALLDHRHWIDMFKDPDSFSADKTDEPVLSQGPKGIFLSLDKDQRKEMYFDYVNQMIPASVRGDDRHPNLRTFIGADTKIDPATGRPILVPKDENVRTVYDNKDTINRSMEAILGIDPINNFGSDEYELASTALMHHYWRDGLRTDPVTGEKLPFALSPTGSAGTGSGLKPQLVHDFDRLARGQPLLDDLDVVEKELPPSILKGALHGNMNVVNINDIPALQQMLSERATKRQEVIGHTRQDVLKARDLGKLEYARNAETLGETFSNLSGTEKALLIFIAYKAFKNMPGIMTGLGALYFGQKFLGGEKDPLNDSWKPLVQGLTGKIKNFAQPAFDSIGLKNNFKKYTDVDIQKRINIIEQYLTEVAKTDIDTSVAGFEILGDMKLSKLQSVFAISDDGSLATIRYGDATFKKEVRKIMDDHGSSPKASEKFFGGADPKDLRNSADLSELSGKYGSDATHDYTSELGIDTVNKHVLDAGHALSTVFYSLAVRRPEHKVAMKQIEYFRRTFGLGTYQDLPDQEYDVDYNNDGVIDHFNPRSLYVYLVRAGAGEASGMEMTLMEFMTSQISQSNLPPSVAVAPAAAPAVVLNPPTNPPLNPPNNPLGPNNQPLNPPNNPGGPNNPGNNPPNNPLGPNNQPPNPPNNPGGPNNPGNNPPNNPGGPNNPGNNPPNNPPNNPGGPNNPGNNPPNNPLGPNNQPSNSSNNPTGPNNSSANPQNNPSNPNNSQANFPSNPQGSKNSVPNSANNPQGASNAPLNAPAQAPAGASNNAQNQPNNLGQPKNNASNAPASGPSASANTTLNPPTKLNPPRNRQ